MIPLFIISKLSFFKGLNCKQEAVLGKERCPYFRGVLQEDFHCVNSYVLFQIHGAHNGESGSAVGPAVTERHEDAAQLGAADSGQEHHRGLRGTAQGVHRQFQVHTLYQMEII